MRRMSAMSFEQSAPQTFFCVASGLKFFSQVGLQTQSSFLATNALCFVKSNVLSPLFFRRESAVHGCHAGQTSGCAGMEYLDVHSSVHSDVCGIRQGRAEVCHLGVVRDFGGALQSGPRSVEKNISFAVRLGRA